MLLEEGQKNYHIFHSSPIHLVTQNGSHSKEAEEKMCLHKLWCKRADTEAPCVIYEFVLIILEKYHTQLLFMPILMGMLSCEDTTEIGERSLL